MSSTASLLANENGLAYLNVNVKLDAVNGRNAKTRAFAVPVQVGPVIQKTEINGQLRKLDEEKIIEMIAE